MASIESENVDQNTDSASASNNPEITKWSIRQKIWDYIEKNDLANYPRPVNHRIPNYKGAEEAGSTVATLDVFKNARTVKINPDKPQMHVRFLTLEANKTLLVPTPRLRTGLFNKLEPPADCGKDVLRICSTAQGVKEYSKPLGLEDKVTVDLVVLGSVAVSEKGFRIGKGEGFADLEFAMMMSMGAVTESTIVVTTVHDCQVTDIPEHLVEAHDVTVDFIVTPTKIIECPYRPKPAGIIWSKLDKIKMQQVPILKKLRAMEAEKGKDTRIRNDIDPDYKPPEREYYRNTRPQGQRRPRQRFNRNRNKSSESGAEKENMAKEETEDKNEYSPDSKPRQRRRRPRNNRRYRDSEASQGEHEQNEGKAEAARESADHGESPEGGKPRPRRRRPNRRRNKDSEHSAAGDDAEEKGDSTDPESKGTQRPPRRRRPRRTSRNFDKENQGDQEEQGGGEGRPPRRRLNRLPSLYVGGIPRSVRVSEFKAKVRGQEVNPISVIWQGGMGRSYLLFDNNDEIDKALEALKGLNINGKDLRIEVSNKTNRLRSNNNNSTIEEKDVGKENLEVQMNGEVEA